MMTNKQRTLPLLILLALFTGTMGSCQSTGGAADDEFSDFAEFDEFVDFGAEEVEEVWDPLSGYNRMMFSFNDTVYTWVWSPVAEGWKYVVPEPARVALDRAYKNFVTPVRFLNALLQLEFMKASTELGRLVVNSTVGIGGLFDPADAWLDWRAPSSEDFGQTLGSYGVGIGFPIVLPFLGPSNLRDGLSLIPDGFANPIPYVTTGTGSTAVWVGNNLNWTSLHLGEYESLKEDGLDPYTLFRDAYQQNRLKKIEE